jgi:hypothetical protein
MKIEPDIALIAESNSEIARIRQGRIEGLQRDNRQIDYSGLCAGK